MPVLANLWTPGHGMAFLMPCVPNNGFLGLYTMDSGLMQLDMQDCHGLCLLFLPGFQMYICLLQISYTGQFCKGTCLYLLCQYSSTRQELIPPSTQTHAFPYYAEDSSGTLGQLLTLWTGQDFLIKLQGHNN